MYADARDPREQPALRAWLDALAGAGEPGPLQVTGSVPWRRQPALYQQHALFVTASADQAREQLACGARVIMIGAGPVAGAVTPAGDGWDLPALREAAGTLRELPPLDLDGIRPALREIFTGSATPARLAALGQLTGLGDHVIAGRRIAVLARADDASAAAALAAGLGRQRLLPAEVVVVTEAPDEPSAEISARAVTAALGDLADRGVSVRAVPAVAGEPAGWLRLAASAARSPWVAPWPRAVRRGRAPRVLPAGPGLRAGVRPGRRDRVRRGRLRVHRHAGSRPGPAGVLHLGRPRPRATALLRQLAS